MARRISGRSHGDPRSADTRAKVVKDDYRPSRDEILRYIAENPDRSGKRDIAKAFALRGDDRIWLKDLLRDLQDEGLLTRNRKR
ncbi:MAG: ribonuclease R, partial [Mesorhizobium sp.]